MRRNWRRPAPAARRQTQPATGTIAVPAVGTIQPESSSPDNYRKWRGAVNRKFMDDIEKVLGFSQIRSTSGAFRNHVWNFLRRTLSQKESRFP
jgi:hypothetical protein